MGLQTGVSLSLAGVMLALLIVFGPAEEGLTKRLARTRATF
jgi:hypothetical protein